jgi:hypothetical protein
MSTAIAFDVYGTLVNPLAVANDLKSLVGDMAGGFAEGERCNLKIPSDEG